MIRPNMDLVYKKGTGMNFLEIISVESVQSKDITKIIEICNDIKVPRSADLSVFRMNLSKEVKCHIEWTFDSLPDGKSSLAQKLSRAFQQYGPVNYALWLEVDQSMRTEQAD